MAIWDQILEQELALETAVNPDVLESETEEVIEQEIKQSEYDKALKRQEEDLQKIYAMNPNNQLMPFRIGGTKAVSGQRSRTLTKGVTYSTLRDLSVFYTVLRACINYRKREMTKQEWDIVAVEPPKTDDEKKKIKADSAEVKKAFRHPTGDKNMSFRDLLNKVIEDVLVLDAMALYRRRNRKGGIFGYLPIDASTIELVITKNGTIPTPPSTAYVQVIDGKDVERLSTDDLIYRMLNPRTSTPYGLSPVETLVITISTALRVGTYNLAYISEGNIPEGFVELPKDIASNPDQLKLWQEAWDAMMAGKYKFQRKIKFLPEGMKWHPVKKTEDMEFKRFEEWLLLNTCFDDETEVLTNNGWKFFKDLSKLDKVITRDENGNLEYNKPSKHQSYYYEGEMVKFKGKRVDLLVTPNHSMYTTYNHGRIRGFSKYKFEKAENLINKDGHLAPVSGKWDSVSNKLFSIDGINYLVRNVDGTRRQSKSDDIILDSNAFAKFLGLWLADGWVRGNKGGKKPGVGTNLGYTVGIAQKIGNKTKDIEKILRSTGLNWKRDGDSYLINNMTLWHYLYKLGNVYTKRIPSDILNMSSCFLENLYEGYLLGDGYVSPSGQRVIISCNDKLLGDFQEVLLKVGLSGSIRKHNSGTFTIRGEQFESKQSYILTIRKSRHVTLNATKENYSGMVYDVTVKNHTLYVRRNGKPVWSGNCSVMEVPPQAIGFQFERGKGATEAEWEIGKERSAFPTANFLTEIFDDIIQEDMGQEHLRFNWTNINPTNKKEEAEVFGMLVKSGAVSVDEWRVAEGYDPIGLDQYMMTPVGPISVKDFVKLSEAGKNPFIPTQVEEADSDLTPPGFVKPKKPEKPAQPVQPKQKLALVDGSIGRKEIREELKRWRKASTNDIMSGKPARDFKTEIIDYRTQQVLREGLSTTKNKVDVYNLFNPYISREGEMLSAVLDLYDEINTINGYDTTEAGSN